MSVSYRESNDLLANVAEGDGFLDDFVVVRVQLGRWQVHEKLTQVSIAFLHECHEETREEG